MKKGFLIMALIAALTLALCAGYAEEAAVERFVDLSGRWEVPGREDMTLTILRTYEMDVPEDEFWYDVEIACPEPDGTETVWYMAAEYDRETTSLCYSDGVRARVAYDESGEIVREDRDWDDSEGALIWINGRLQWADKREDLAGPGPELRFERVRQTEPIPQAFEEDYFLPVANVETGTAGASLKAAALALDVARFAHGNDLWDANIRGMREDMMEAWERLPEETRARFDENFMGIVVPLLDDAFGNYDAVAAQFEDAGVGADMARLAGDRFARASWHTLLGNTLTLGNDDGGELEAGVEDGKFAIYIPMSEFDEGYWTTDLEGVTTVRLVSETMVQDGYRAVLAPAADGDAAVRFRHMDKTGCEEYYDYALTVRDGALQLEGEGSHVTGPDEWDQDAWMCDHWVDASGLAAMDIDKNGSGYDVRIVAAEASGAHVWTMTVYYDCTADAFVYDNGARFETAISDSPEADLGEAEYTFHGGRLFFEGEKEGTGAVLRWMEDGDEAAKPLRFARVETGME